MTVPLRQLILEADLIYCPPKVVPNAVGATVATLTPQQFAWKDRDQYQTLNVEDILGVAPFMRGNTVGFRVSACPLRQRHRWTQIQYRRLENYDFYCSAEMKIPWLRAFAKVIHPAVTRLVVIVNARSGRGQGDKIFQQVRPLFEASQIQLTVTPSEDGEQTRQLAQSLDFTDVDGLVVVGGDGTVHDVINGLMLRSDAETAIQTPIGVIPAGTGNGLCQSLLAKSDEPYDVLSAGFAIAKGTPQPLDVLQIQQQEQQFYGLLSLEWGLISDIDLGSERWRWLGPIRNDIYALLLILRLRSYAGHLTFWQEGREQTLEGQFIAVWGMNVPWATYDTLAAPGAQLSDGHLELLMVRQGASRWRLIQAFLRLETGGHLAFPEVEHFKVQTVHLAPGTQAGTLAVDGEEVIYRPISVKVLPGLSRFFVLQVPSQ